MHKLKISKLGIAAFLKGTQVTEEVNVDRDDFKLEATYGKGYGPIPKGKEVWILGLKGSKTPNQFTDRIDTGSYAVLYTMEKYRPRLPARRNETQYFYWRRHKNDNWRWFATVKIYFIVDKNRKDNKLFARTVDNSVVVREQWDGRRPKGY